jgi:two-component system, NarL family, nitrate/nitrite response regulator NarL
MNKIRLLIIEDNKLLREGIRSTLKRQKDILVLAALSDKVKIIDKIRDLKPDVLLLDIGLPNFFILGLVKSLKLKYPKTKIILMGLIPVQAEINLYIKAGIKGFILKGATIEEFLKIIRSVAAGIKEEPVIMKESLFSKIIEDEVKVLRASKLMESLKMSPQEKDIILFIAGGMNDRKIAKKLGISEYKVKSHVDNIIEKMAMNSRVQISIYLNAEIDGSNEFKKIKKKNKK